MRNIGRLLWLALPVWLAGCERPTAPSLEYNAGTADAVGLVLNEGVSAEGGAAASLGEPQGWGTITGTFRINGTPPTRSPLSVTKDTNVCSPGGMPILEEGVVVGSGGGIQNVLVFVSSNLPQDDPLWEHPSYEAGKFGEVEFDQKRCIFLSHVAAMRATQKLKVMNSDPVGHNTNLDSKRGAASGNFTVPSNAFAYYEPGAASPAPFPVSCSIHPWMKAWLMVCDHPYFAVSGEDGSFQIANVPAGVELEFRVWQETAGYLQTVTVNGQAANWSKGRFKLNLNPDETYQMDVVVDAGAF